MDPFLPTIEKDASNVAKAATPLPSPRKYSLARRTPSSSSSASPFHPIPFEPLRMDPVSGASQSLLSSLHPSTSSSSMSLSSSSSQSFFSKQTSSSSSSSSSASSSSSFFSSSPSITPRPPTKVKMKANTTHTPLISKQDFSSKPTVKTKPLLTIQNEDDDEDEDDFADYWKQPEVTLHQKSEGEKKKKMETAKKEGRRIGHDKMEVVKASSARKVATLKGKEKEKDEEGREEDCNLINQLPEEILVYIFSFVAGCHLDLVSVGEVCRRWHRIEETLWFERCRQLSWRPPEKPRGRRKGRVKRGKKEEVEEEQEKEEEGQQPFVLTPDFSSWKMVFREFVKKKKHCVSCGDRAGTAHPILQRLICCRKCVKGVPLEWNFQLSLDDKGQASSSLLRNTTVVDTSASLSSVRLRGTSDTITSALQKLMSSGRGRKEVEVSSVKGRIVPIKVTSSAGDWRCLGKGEAKGQFHLSNADLTSLRHKVHKFGFGRTKIQYWVRDLRKLALKYFDDFEIQEKKLSKEKNRHLLREKKKEKGEDRSTTLNSELQTRSITLSPQLHTYSFRLAKEWLQRGDQVIDEETGEKLTLRTLLRKIEEENNLVRTTPFLELYSANSKLKKLIKERLWEEEKANAVNRAGGLWMRYMPPVEKSAEKVEKVFRSVIEAHSRSIVSSLPTTSSSSSGFEWLLNPQSTPSPDSSGSGDSQSEEGEEEGEGPPVILDINEAMMEEWEEVQKDPMTFFKKQPYVIPRRLKQLLQQLTSPQSSTTSEQVMGGKATSLSSTTIPISPPIPSSSSSISSLAATSVQQGGSQSMEEELEIGTDSMALPSPSPTLSSSHTVAFDSESEKSPTAPIFPQQPILLTSSVTPTKKSSIASFFAPKSSSGPLTPQNAERNLKRLHLFTVPELKEKCAEFDLKKGGKKGELIERLTKAYKTVITSSSATSSDLPSPSSSQLARSNNSSNDGSACSMEEEAEERLEEAREEKEDEEDEEVATMPEIVDVESAETTDTDFAEERVVTKKKKVISTTEKQREELKKLKLMRRKEKVVAEEDGAKAKVEWLEEEVRPLTQLLLSRKRTIQEREREVTKEDNGKGKEAEVKEEEGSEMKKRKVKTKNDKKRAGFMFGMLGYDPTATDAETYFKSVS